MKSPVNGEDMVTVVEKVTMYLLNKPVEIQALTWLCSDGDRYTDGDMDMQNIESVKREFKILYGKSDSDMVEEFLTDHIFDAPMKVSGSGMIFGSVNTVYLCEILNNHPDGFKRIERMDSEKVYFPPTLGTKLFNRHNMRIVDESVKRVGLYSATYTYADREILFQFKVVEE